MVGHSIAAAIAVSASQQAPESTYGIFSIEGNLTEDDTFFTGKAADCTDPLGFKNWFLEYVWEMAQSQPVLRRYYAAAEMADPTAMLELGQDAKNVSTDCAVGEAYLGLSIPSLYFWSRGNTPEKTQRYIASSGLENLEFTNASHWPSVDATEVTAEAIGNFFRAQNPSIS